MTCGPVHRVRHCLWVIIALLLLSITGDIWGRLVAVQVVRRSIQAHDDRVKIEVLGRLDRLTGDVDMLRARGEILEAKRRD